MTSRIDTLYSRLMATHDYQKYAQYYAEIGIRGTYYLAFRDLDQTLEEFAGKTALDFGCGAGRSSRFLKKSGIHTIGVDQSEDMIAQARARDPNGKYHLISPGDLSRFDEHTIDLVFSSFALMEISRLDEITAVLQEMSRVLKATGLIIIIVSNPPIATSRCVSFNKDFPENQNLQSGDRLRLDITEASETFTLYDYFWTEQDYRDAFTRAGLSLIKVLKPLGTPDDGIDWLAEAAIAPFVTFFLKKTPA